LSARANPARRVRRWLIIAASVLTSLGALLALAAVSAVLLMSGPFGRELVREMADGREVAGYGVLRMGPVSGNVLGRFEISRLEIEGGDGVWLTARNITIDWSPRALLGGALVVQSLDVEEAHILQRPERAEQEISGEGRFEPPPVRIERAAAQLRLADGVAGPEAVYRIEGGVDYGRAMWTARLDAERTDAPGDRISGVFEARERLFVEADVFAAPGGALASLLQAPETGLTGRVRASGGWSEGEGEAVLNMESHEAARLDARWRGGELQLSGQADPGAWPGFETLALLLGGPAAFSASAPYGPDGLGSLDIDRFEAGLESPSFTFSVVRRSAVLADVRAEGREHLAGVLTNGAAEARRIVFEGQMSLDEGAPSLGGEVRISGFSTAPGVYFETLQGGVHVSGALEAPRLQADLRAQGGAYESELLQALLGAAPSLAGVLVYLRDEQRLTMEAMRANLPSGAVQGDAMLDFAAGRWRTGLESARADISRLAPQFGGAGAVSIAASGGFDGEAAFEAVLTGFTPADGLEDYLDAPVNAVVNGRRNAQGDLVFDRLSLQSGMLALEAEGGVSGEDWRLAGEAAWSGASPFAALMLEGALEAAFEAGFSSGVLDLRADIAAGALRAGPLAVNDARLRLEAAGPLGALGGEARLTGASPRGPVDLAARFARDGEALSLTGLDGRAGAVSLSGGADTAPGRLATRLELSPWGGFGNLVVDADISNGRIEASIRARDFVGRDLAYIDDLTARLSGPLEEALFTFSAHGAYGARFNADMNGRMRLAGGPFEAVMTLDGRYGPVPFASIEPLRLSSAPAPGAEARLRLAGGEGAFAYQGGENSRFHLSLESAPAALLSLRRSREPVEGVIDARVDLSRDDGVWRGEGFIEGYDLRPADALDEEALAGGMRASLDERRLSVTAEAGGAGLTARASAELAAGPVSGLADVMRPDTPITAEFSADGEISAFAAFHIDPAQSLSGLARLDARVSGVLARPLIEGEARLSGGAFRDERIGLWLQDVELRGVFDEDDLRIESLTAAGSEGGRLEAQGTARFGEDGFGASLEARFDGLQAVRRSDLIATATGAAAFTLADGQGLLTGEARIDRAEIRPRAAGREPVPMIEVIEINAPGGAANGAGGRAIPIMLDYRITAPARVFVRGPNFDTEWALDVRAAGRADAPELSGTATLVRGRADVLNRGFQLETGRVVFSGAPDTARLNIVAAHQARAITARVNVAGSVGAPEVSLSSSPLLPEDEIVSRLLFGEGSAQLGAVEGAQLAASLASLRGGSGFNPIGSLRTAARLDQLGLRTGADGQTIVSGGRYITDSVYLEMESDASGDAPSTRIEWALNRNLTLLSRLARGGDAAVALSWRREYD